jgi:hypothetical protein
MPIALPISFEDIKKQTKLRESFDETIAIREERSAPRPFQSMKFYTGFVSEDKSEFILRTWVHENGVHRVCVPEKKQNIYWRDTSGMCSPKITSPTVSLQGSMTCMGRQISSRTWSAMSQVKVMCKLIILSKQRYQPMIHTHLVKRLSCRSSHCH